MTDIVERLQEPIVADAFQDKRITDGRLADRLIRERGEAADEIERLRKRVAELERLHLERDRENAYKRHVAETRAAVVEAMKGGKGRVTNPISRITGSGRSGLHMRSHG